MAVRLRAALVKYQYTQLPLRTRSLNPTVLSGVIHQGCVQLQVYTNLTHVNHSVQNDHYHHFFRSNIIFGFAVSDTSQRKT